MGKELSDSSFLLLFSFSDSSRSVYCYKRQMPAEEARSRFECEIINSFNVKMRQVPLEKTRLISATGKMAANVNLLPHNTFRKQCYKLSPCSFLTFVTFSVEIFSK